MQLLTEAISLMGVIIKVHVSNRVRASYEASTAVRRIIGPQFAAAVHPPLPSLSIFVGSVQRVADRSGNAAAAKG